MKTMKKIQFYQRLLLLGAKVVNSEKRYGILKRRGAKFYTGLEQHEGEEYFLESLETEVGKAIWVT